MNETAELANNLPAIILISVWWAFLTTLDAMFTAAREAEKAARPAAKPPDEDTDAEGEAVFAGFRAIDPACSAEAFLKGARRAYETVLHAYAMGDFKTLRPLLSGEVLEAFSDACAGRRERQETLELTIIGIESAEIVGVDLTPTAMQITVHLRAQIISAERAADGDVVAGDPNAIVVSTDLWTFARPLPLDGSTWVVIATDELVGEPA